MVLLQNTQVKLYVILQRSVYIYISKFLTGTLQIGHNTKKLIVGMTFSFKCYC